MIKNLLNKVLIMVFASFFFVNVNAVTEVALDNLSYADYLNIYNLQFDDREIAQKYYNFLTTTNLHDFLFANVDNFGLSVQLNPQNFYYDYVNDSYFISLLGLSTDGNNHYNLSNGIPFNIYLSFSDGKSVDFDSYLSNSGTIFRLYVSPGYKYRYFPFTLYLDSDNNFKIKTRTSNRFDNVYSDNIIDLKLQNPIQFLGAFYQSSFTVNYKDNVANVPVGFTSFHFYNDLNKYYTSKDAKYLGYDYFDNNVYFGAGVPLYPAYSIFTNSFEFGDPYTSGFNHIYFGNNQCYFAPTQKLLNDYDNLHSSGEDSLWFTYTDRKASFDWFNYSSTISYFSISDLGIFDSNYSYVSDTDSIKKYNFVLDYSKYSNGKFLKLSPNLINLNSIIRFSVDNYDQQFVIYYKKDLWNYTCATGSNEFTLELSDGSTLTGKNSSLSDSSSDNFFTSFINSISDFLGSALSYFIRFVSSLTGFAKIVIDCFVKLFEIFGSFFIFVGSSISLMFGCFPDVVVETFKIILIFTSLIVVFKFIIGR